MRPGRGQYSGGVSGLSFQGVEIWNSKNLWGVLISICEGGCRTTYLGMDILHLISGRR